MILSAQSIRARGILTPFHERTRHNGMTFGLSPAGYDVRCKQEIELAPGSFCRASTVEHFQMPNDLLGRVADKSTWARRGLCVQNTVIEPGWRGFLTLELTNHSSETILIKEGDPIAQIIFDMLDAPTEIPYEGKYQDQNDQPVEALRDSGIPQNSGSCSSQ